MSVACETSTDGRRVCFRLRNLPQRAHFLSFQYCFVIFMKFGINADIETYENENVSL